MYKFNLIFLFVLFFSLDSNAQCVPDENFVPVLIIMVYHLIRWQLDM